MTRALAKILAVMLLALGPRFPCAAADKTTPVNDRQLAALFFIDYGRSYGYQVMMARIQLETDRAELARDEKILVQKEELWRRQAIPQIDLEIARLKDIWNRKQIVVSEKNLAYLTAEYEAMQLMAKHFAGIEVSVEALYATFRRGWDAGCDKGPDEVEAMKAWADFQTKLLERSRELNSQGNEPLSALYEKETQIAIARSNYQNRSGSLDRCRAVLFPSLEDILAIKR